MGRTFSLSELNYIIDKRISVIGSSGLQTSNSTVINVSNAAPPEIGQVLTAMSVTTATWQNSSIGMPLGTDVPIDETPGISGAPGNENFTAHSDHVHALPPFGTSAGTFCEGNDPRLSTLVSPGSISIIPAASAVRPGTIYFPIDDDYRFVSNGESWLIDVPYCPVLQSPGDLSTWTYESGTPNYANMLSHGGVYSTLTCLAENPTPDYVDFLSASPTIVGGTNNVWTITATIRYAGIGVAGSTNLYQNVGIFLLDENDHRFMWGISLGISFFASAHAAGFTGHTRNYYSALNSPEMSDLNPANYTYHVRIRHTSAGLYFTEYSRDGRNWSISTNGGTNVLLYGIGSQLIPTRWGIGCEYIPAGLANWDILQLRQSSIDEGA
jgi:hypothetical protein